MREVYFLGRKWGRGGDILMLLDVMVHQNSWVLKRIRDAYKLGVALGVFRQK
jgi:hypothetical protein